MDISNIERVETRSRREMNVVKVETTSLSTGADWGGGLHMKVYVFSSFDLLFFSSISYTLYIIYVLCRL